MKNRLFAAIAAFAAMLLITSCTSAPNTPAPPEAHEPEAVEILFSSGGYVPAEDTEIIRYLPAPYRLEFTLYNVKSVDMDAVRDALSVYPFISDIYPTVVLDDSMCRFTVEFTCPVEYTADISGYSDGHIDLTLAQADAADPAVYLVRSSSDDPGEGLALLAEAVYDLPYSTVKTASGKFCIIAAAVPDMDEAQRILAQIGSDSFFIEETLSSSRPE